MGALDNIELLSKKTLTFFFKEAFLRTAGIKLRLEVQSNRIQTFAYSRVTYKRLLWALCD